MSTPNEVRTRASVAGGTRDPTRGYVGLSGVICGLGGGLNGLGGGPPRGGISRDGTPGERLVRFIVDFFRFVTPALFLVVLVLDFGRILAPK